MKLAAVIFVALLTVTAGCQKPDPIIVDSGVPIESPIEVTPIAQPDTNQRQAAVDTTGVSPLDGTKFGAMLLVGSVEYDAGAALTHTESFSSVYFADRAKPLVINGKTVGFYGMDLGLAIAINGLPMIRLPYHLPFPGLFRDTISGYIYAKDLAGVHQPNSVFQWVIGTSSVIGSFNLSITTPDNIQVISPAGGSILPRNQDLLLRWTGRGNVNIVISVVNPLTKKTRPLFNLHPRLNTGRAILDYRILQLLPRERTFVFTFVIDNRDTTQAIGLYPAKILVQAASVHNSYVEFQ